MDNRPKIGIAMSGAAARSVFYIGFLQSLDKYKVPIDFITAYSGAAIVAAAYSLGKLEVLKQEALEMDKKFLLSLFKRSQDSRGWYSLDDFEKHIYEKYSNGKKLEEVNPRLSFLATDIKTGEQVELNLGDIARAVKITCSMPGVFEPVEWGSKLLVDGGLVSTLPVENLKAVGMDIVVGVRVRSNKYFFFRNDRAMGITQKIIKNINIFKLFEPWFDKLKKVASKADLFGLFEDIKMYEPEEKPEVGIFSVLGKCLDIAVKSTEKETFDSSEKKCDLFVSVGTPSLVGSMNVNDGRILYEQGLKAGEEAAPKILELIKNYKNK